MHIEKVDGMKILVTGSNGYIGSVLCEQLIDAGHSVIAIDNLEHEQNSLAHLFHTGKLKFIHGDVTSDSFMEKTLKNEKYDFIIPLAAVVGFPLSEFKPEYAAMVNVEQICSILAYKHKKAGIIFPNTNSGYGNAKGGECTEESPLNPSSAYGKTKCQAERIITANCDNYVVFRLATVFGMSPRIRTDLLVNNFVWKAVHDKSLVLFERKFTRNFVHVRDVCRAFIFAIDNWKKMKNNIYNLGHPKFNITKLKLAEMIKKEVPDLEIIFREGRTDPDKRDYIISNAKILATGFKFEYPLDRGIKELIEGYKSMKNTKFQNWDDVG